MFLKLILPGQPITKKNHAMIKCVNGRPLYVPAKAYRDYEKLCKKHIWAIMGGRVDPIIGDITICAHYYLANARRPDLINLMQATADILEAANVIENDRQIVSWDGTKIAGIDRHNPRVEIEIKYESPQKKESEHE